MRELAEKEYEKDTTINLAQRILQKAHPDAVSVIKHWITIIQSRWDEVSTWAKQVYMNFSYYKCHKAKNLHKNIRNFNYVFKI